MYDRRLLTELELSVRSEKNKRQRRPDRMTTEIESVEINISLLEATCSNFFVAYNVPAIYVYQARGMYHSI